MEQKTSDREIDVLEVAAKFYRTLLNNKLTTFLFLIVGLLSGFVVSTFSKDSTHASMMIETSLLSESEFQFLMEQLNRADSIKGLTRQQERSISAIEYEVKKGETFKEDFKDITQLYLKINTLTEDKVTLQVLQNALINYLNQAEPVMRNRMQRKLYYEKMIARIDDELKGLEAVQNQIDDKSKATYLDPSDLFDKSVKLYEQRLKYEIALADIKSVHVIKGFGSLTKSAQWSKARYAAVGFACGVVALLLFLAIKSFHRHATRLNKTT